MERFHVITPGGVLLSGARAFVYVWSQLPGWRHLARLAQSRKIAPKKFIKDMQKAGRLPSVRSSILIGKAIDFLVEQATVVESAETVITEE